MLVYFVSY